jgi:hypothetical protein
MRLSTLSAIVAAGLFVGSARAASVSVVSGTLHADSHARTTSSSSTLTDTPPNLSLGAGTVSGSVSSSIDSDPLQADDMTGSASVGLNVSGTVNNQFTANFSAHGSANVNVGGIGGGTGTIDLIFNLDSASAVKFITSNNPGNGDLTHDFKILDSSHATIYTVPNGDVISSPFNLVAGNYEFTGTLVGSGAVGSQGGGVAQVEVQVVPEPVMFAALGSFALLRYRRRRMV